MEYLRLSAHYLRIDYVSPVSTDLGVSFVCRFCASLVREHMDSPGFLMDYLWLPYGSPKDSPWITHGFYGPPMGPPWIPDGFPMGSLWIPYGFSMDSLWIPYGST